MGNNVLDPTVDHSPFKTYVHNVIHVSLHKCSRYINCCSITFFLGINGVVNIVISLDTVCQLVSSLPRYSRCSRPSTHPRPLMCTYVLKGEWSTVGSSTLFPICYRGKWKACLICAYEKGSLWNIGSCKVVLADTIQRAHVVGVCHKSI
jgi:hypothetical protein